MVKVLFALAKYLTWSFIKPLVSHCCVANLTRMLQTSSFNPTHVLVALNSISLSCFLTLTLLLLNPLPVLIILLNTLPVLVALKILREILSFTRLLMINTLPLVGCLENSDQKVKQFPIIPRIASRRLVYCSSIHWPNWMCLVLQRDSRFVSWNCHATHITLTGLARMAFKSSLVINFV